MSLFGARKLARGRDLDRRQAARASASPRDAIRHGLAIALVPEDRKTEGLMLPMSVRDNLTLAVLGAASRARRAPAVDASRRPSRRRCERLQIKTRDAGSQQVGTLSGGNQQKVLIGRWLLAEPDVLLLFDITRGVDVGTKHDIYELSSSSPPRARRSSTTRARPRRSPSSATASSSCAKGASPPSSTGDRRDAEAIVAASVRETPRDALGRRTAVPEPQRGCSTDFAQNVPLLLALIILAG